VSGLQLSVGTGGYQTENREKPKENRMQSSLDPHESRLDTVPSRPAAPLWQTFAVAGMVLCNVGLLSSCILATEEPVPDPDLPRYERYARGPEMRVSERYARSSYEDVDIPPRYWPPAGSCRIWFPDRPPRYQPPPGDCYELRRRVPPGATLVYGR
jgi:hypothetical protein